VDFVSEKVLDICMWENAWYAVWDFAVLVGREGPFVTEVDRSLTG
jgi:hypothetical protein